jgi:CubicO group peptidase (beta-lactamase class C family)
LLSLALAVASLVACDRDQPAPRRALDPVALTASIERELVLNPALDRLRAVVVMRDGKVVYEHYQRATPEDHWNLDAITGTVLTALVGIAIHDGQIPGLGATLGQLLPDRSMPRQVARTNLRQLLTMTAGFDVPATDRAEPFVDPRDPVGTILRSQANPPGQFFDYSDQGAHLLSAVLERATGLSVLAYARINLFTPLGIGSAPAAQPLGTARAIAAHGPDLTWTVDRSGLQDGWNGLKLRPRDLARIGQVFLDDGRWRGRQVVPGNWAQVATLTQVPTEYEVAPGYGYGWWVDHGESGNAFFGWGYGGQLLEVLPRERVVVAILTEQDPANLVRGFFAAELTSLVDQTIMPAVLESAARSEP